MLYEGYLYTERAAYILSEGEEKKLVRQGFTVEMRFKLDLA